MRVRCYGGPLHDHEFELKAGQTSFYHFAWRYEMTPKRVGDHWIFVRVPNPRPVRRLLKYILASGQPDPRMRERQAPRRGRAARRNAPCYCGSKLKWKHCHGGNHVQH
jgi:hypothetical protein